MAKYLLFLFVHAIEGAKTLYNYLALSTLGFKILPRSKQWKVNTRWNIDKVWVILKYFKLVLVTFFSIN